MWKAVLLPAFVTHFKLNMLSLKGSCFGWGTMPCDIQKFVCSKLNSSSWKALRTSSKLAMNPKILNILYCKELFFLHIAIMERRDVLKLVVLGNPFILLKCHWTFFNFLPWAHFCKRTNFSTFSLERKICSGTNFSTFFEKERFFLELHLFLVLTPIFWISISVPHRRTDEKLALVCACRIFIAVIFWRVRPAWLTF